MTDTVFLVTLWVTGMLTGVTINAAQVALSAIRR